MSDSPKLNENDFQEWLEKYVPPKLHNRIVDMEDRVIIIERGEIRMDIPHHLKDKITIKENKKDSN